MKKTVYISSPDHELQYTPQYEWIKENREHDGLTFRLTPSVFFNDAVYRGYQEIINTCDVHVVFAVSRGSRMYRIGSYNSDIEVQRSIYRGIPIIVIKLRPDFDAVGTLALDEFKTTGRVRVFDMSEGHKIEELPRFIMNALSELEDSADEDGFAAGELEKPYEGDEPYIFVSYSHLDREKVYPIIARLQHDGYRLWYDEGIHAASQWDEYIASHIKDCGFMLAFISPNYIESANCKDEISYARDLNKERLLVYLEETKLPLGMAMRLKRLQAVNRYEYKSGAEFYGKLTSAKGMSEMKE